MSLPKRGTDWAPFLPLLWAGLAAAILSACLFENKVAGGSSEVDNPIVVAFVDSAGGALSTSGSLSIYLAGQNPAVDPDPILRKQLAGPESVELSARDFTQGVYLDSARTYNLLLLDDDSSGALVQNITYNPRTGKYTLGDTRVSSVRMSPTPLVRYSSTLFATTDSGVVRIIVPGTPFQTILVDSGFVLEGVPSGDLPLHAIVGGEERPLVKDSSAGPQNPRHRIDTTKPPLPPPPPPHDTVFTARAGDDQSIYFSPGPQAAEFTLNGIVPGFSQDDPRIATQWHQMPDSQAPKATIQKPGSRNTKVFFPKPGAYRFVFSAAFGSASASDTVLIGVLGPPEAALFIAPAAGDSVRLGAPFHLAWHGTKNDTLTLQISRDTGNTWETVPGTFIGKTGVNQRTWTPQGEASASVRVRLRDKQNATVTTSGDFSLIPNPGPPAGPQSHGAWWPSEDSGPSASGASQDDGNENEQGGPNAERNSGHGPEDRRPGPEHALPETHRRP